MVELAEESGEKFRRQVNQLPEVEQGKYVDIFSEKIMPAFPDLSNMKS